MPGVLLLKQGGLFAPISREGALVFNNLFLVTACATVLIGTCSAGAGSADRPQNFRRAAVLQRDFRSALRPADDRDAVRRRWSARSGHVLPRPPCWRPWRSRNRHRPWRPGSGVSASVSPSSSSGGRGDHLVAAHDHFAPAAAHRIAARAEPPRSAGTAFAPPIALRPRHHRGHRLGQRSGSPKSKPGESSLDMAHYR